MWDYVTVVYVSFVAGVAVGFIIAALITANDERKDK